ncbi:MAG: sulfate ABC transporter substrate-binding protein [Chitinophagaceae bacterium]|nr:sulfate ABC transporter substrate-binding protein [Anaerolineae bacterium]
MNRKFVRRIVLMAFSLLLLTFSSVSAQDAPPPVTLTLVAYAVPREAYGEIIPLFQAYWLEETGQTVRFLESYQGSGTQSRAVAGGFEADIVALALEPDVTRLVDAGLISPEWKENNPYQGFVTDSVVVIATREGNPLEITDWADLGAEDIEVITPNPATSGGARWNILGAYGAARRGFVEGYEATDEGGIQFLTDLITNVEVLDRDARESFLTFERGIGDVAITYENEYYAGVKAGGEYDVVYPRSTILIENPIAIVDTYVDLHGTREVAEAFVQFLWTQNAQRIFASNGFRPVNPVVAADYGLDVEVPADLPEETVTVEINPDIAFPSIEDLFTIDEFGGWAEAQPAYFGEDGSIIRLITEIKGS